MTLEQFKMLRVGDVVLDNNHRQKPRTIHKISVVHGKAGPRYALTVDNLKQPGAKTIYFFSEVTGPPRFDFPPTT